MKHKKRALFNSVVSLLLCLSMFVGTTFAWFTDEVVSGGNIIASGNLDATMEYATDPNGEWKNAADGAIFSYEYWEPGYTDMKFIRIGNAGNLAFRYQLHILPSEATPEGEADLAEAIDVYYGEVGEGFTVPTDFTTDMPGMIRVGTLAELIGDTDGAAHGVLLPENGSQKYTLNEADKLIAKTGSTTACIMLHMREDAGNEYQNLTVGGNFEVRLIATQYTYENDTFGNDYDADSDMPLLPGNWEASASVAVDNGVTSEAASVGAASDRFNAEVPAGVKMAENETELSLKISALLSGEANVTLKQGEKKTALDVHMDGVAEDNTVPMVITLGSILPTGLNSTSVELYHVENGVTVAMKQVATPANHNEYSYDPATGTVVVALATFSEVMAVADTTNPWEGNVDTSWYNTTDTEFTINNAEQFAGFRDLVDEGNTFEGKTIKLDANINLNGKLFDPIGWGYENTDYNVGDAAGRPFKGIFDGNNKTISNLYQSGWDLETETGTDYTYTNCGFGLFASACDATIKNLTITGAYVRVECVEAGILVGLSQGNCNYSNIKIYDSKIANYQRPAGGLIGEVSPNPSGVGTTTITDVTIGSNVVVGSLWGDFDAPVGGVIGARWDDSNTTSVVMNKVDVACRLDVYNDITSTYQWHAYRRAGMLIGNTDTPPADGKNSKTATADFLTCENVTVRYGSWVNYHYCEFTNHNSSWPWVRVEAGENCSAYSNPRYGVPNDPVTGQPVTSLEHNHSGNDTHYELIKFNQLYGGGQGVYGVESHEGVHIQNYYYKVEYINDSVTHVTVEVTDANLNDDGTFTVANADAETAVENQMGDGYEVDHWMNAGSTTVTTVLAGNLEDIKLYPSFKGRYTATFVNQKGEILSWMLFTEGATSLTLPTNVPAISGFTFNNQWMILAYNEDGTLASSKEYNATNLAAVRTDITLYPVYTYSGAANLIPVDNDGDGDTDEYQVAGYSNGEGSKLVEIPGSVNGIPVTSIQAESFSSYADLTAVRIPANVTSIGSQSFAEYEGYTRKRQTVTLYYEGTPEQWAQYMKEVYTDKNYEHVASDWDEAMGAGSRVFFLVNGKVDNTRYWEMNSDFEWVFHEHAYTYDAAKGCTLGEESHYEYGGGIFGYGASLQEDKFTDYDAATRPDVAYWTAE